MSITDSQIQELIDEPKKWKGKKAIKLKREQSHKRFDCNIETESGNLFSVFIRQRRDDLLDFSIGLTYTDKTTGEKICLFRCNGTSHEHKNHIEDNKLKPSFHIHKATSRYIEKELKPDGWACQTDDFDDIHSALLYFSKSININPPLYMIEKPKIPELWL